MLWDVLPLGLTEGVRSGGKLMSAHTHYTHNSNRVYNESFIRIKVHIRIIIVAPTVDVLQVDLYDCSKNKCVTSFYTLKTVGSKNNPILTQLLI